MGKRRKRRTWSDDENERVWEQNDKNFGVRKVWHLPLSAHFLRVFF